MLKHGFNINDLDENGNTALMHALSSIPAKKSISILRKMLKCPSIELSARNESGETALHIELRRMTSLSLSIIKMIVARGGDVNIASKDGLTPLTLCIVWPDELWVRHHLQQQRHGVVELLDPNSKVSNQ